MIATTVAPGDVVSALRGHATDRAETTAVTWLADLARPEASLTYGELDDRAAAVASALRQRVEPGSRVLLLHRPGLSFVEAFAGALYAGCLPVPVYPLLDTTERVAVVRRIAEDCGASLAWASDAGVAGAAEQALSLPAAWATGAGRFRPDGPPDAGAPAFLQYTSGSTSAPKGVVITHGNLAANLDAIAAAFGTDSGSVVLSWLPTHHDMGLIGNLLHPLRSGCHAYLASPLAFLRYPVRWLEAVARHGVTASGGPNFAYDLVVDALRATGAPPVDLSAWATAYSGAEPVSAETLRRFAEALSPCGFSPRALVPCYGLAEATLLVTSVPIGSGVRSRRAADGTMAVSCGEPQGCQVAVVGPGGATPLPPGHVGEILVKGPSVATGYWGDPGATEDGFGATVAGSEGRWLRTGDLGFLAEGELHVSGRSKDVIVVRGRNHHPHDLERLVTERFPAFRPGRVVACASPSGTGVVVVGELRSRWVDAAADRRRLAVDLAAEHGLALVDFVGVPRGSVPRTTSGKLRRDECRRRYLSGAYDSRRTVTAVPDPERPSGLATAVVDEFFGQPVDAAEPLVAYGLDSLGAVRLAHLLERRAGLDVPVRALLAGATLANLAVFPLSAAEAVPGPAEPHGRLSKAQESLMFLQALDPDSDDYNITFAWELAPGTDIAAFGAALRRAIRAQPELATGFVPDGARWRRAKATEEALGEALAPAPATVADDGLAERLATSAARPFRPDGGPMLRLHLWRTPSRLVHQLVVHHAVTDLWSLALLLETTADAYGAIRSDGCANVRPLAAYDSYVRDQEDFLASPAAGQRDAELAARLPRRAESLGLRTDHPHRPRRTRRSARVSRSVPSPSAPAPPGPEAVAHLVALWAACLHRYGTPNPVVVGVPVVGGPSGRHAGVAGLCTNTVPLAVQVEPSGALAELCAEAARQLANGMEAGLYPLARAVEVVRPHRQAGRAPLVETMVTVAENPVPGATGLLEALAGNEATVAVGPLQLRSVPVPRSSCRYDLDLVVTPGADGYLVTLDYATDLFAPETAASILATYAAMVAAAPGARSVADTFVLSEEDRAELAVIGRSEAPPLDPPIVARIASLAAAEPSRPAIVHGDRVVEFAAFGRMAAGVGASLAAALPAGELEPARRQAGVLCGSPADFAVAMFGAWAAGLGVLPLPVDFPDGRLGAMLADCAPATVLAPAADLARARRLVAGLSTSIPVLALERAMAAGGRPVAPPPDAPAFTVYTSGSSGQPKGVLIRQDQVAPLVAWSGRQWGLGPWVRMAQTLSLGFDFGLQELFTSLPHGGCLVVPEPSDRASARRYAQFLRRQRVTVLFTTPSYADQLAAAGEALPDLRLVLLGGEILRAATVRGFRALLGPGCRLVNGYGPTEATVNCLAYDVPTEAPGAELPAVLPVGSATAAARVSLVDGDGRPVPAGAVGEILIGGPGVADGYLNRPELSGERFVAVPPLSAGGTWYRSGDLAYVRPGHGFVVIGRNDRQVKLRGFRAELGEVEAALASTPGVAAATALVVPEPERLVAFLAGPGIVVSDVLAHVGAQLPPSMVPEQVVLVTEFPVTPNGKRDDDALRRRAASEHSSPLGAAASPAEVEAAISEVWASALGVERLGPDDHVFDAGAHSLVATSVHHRLQAVLGVAFPVHDLFEYPTPRGLALRLGAQRPPSPTTSPAAPGAEARKDEL